MTCKCCSMEHVRIARNGFALVTRASDDALEARVVRFGERVPPVIALARVADHEIRPLTAENVVRLVVARIADALDVLDGGTEL